MQLQTTGTGPPPAGLVAAEFGGRVMPGEAELLGPRLPRYAGEDRPARPTFYLGCPEPSWLLPAGGIAGTRQAAAGLALFPSWSRFRRLADPAVWATEYRAQVLYEGAPIVPYALDSGGFNEVTEHGGHRSTAAAYVEDVTWLDGSVPGMQWAAPQDWMCEDESLAKTGLTVLEHQRRTVANFVELVSWWWSPRPCPFRPVLQGRTVADYLRCARMYEDAGVDLRQFRTVGVGSVCRLQSTGAIADVLGALAAQDLWLHGFGVKTEGLTRAGRHLVSSDSQAWSFDARYAPALPGHTHLSCVSCVDYALADYDRITALLDRPAPAAQLALLDFQEVLSG